MTVADGIALNWLIINRATSRYWRLSSEDEFKIPVPWETREPLGASDFDFGDHHGTGESDVLHTQPLFEHSLRFHLQPSFIS
jgi:hypothetical protein